VKGGVTTGGDQDISDTGYQNQDTLLAAGSSLSTVNGNIQITLNTGDPNVEVNQLETFRGTVVSASRVLITQFDASATAAGSIDLQTSTKAPPGGYAFNLGGYDGSNPQQNLAIGGILNISGASITPAGSILDYNDGYAVQHARAIASGTVGAPDAFGSVVITVKPKLGVTILRRGRVHPWERIRSS
jgi:hypothetical protein